MAAQTRLTVFFQDPFWVGLWEREWVDSCEVCRMLFGSEPTDGEIYALLTERWTELRFHPGLPSRETLIRNPKRRQWQIRKLLSDPGVGTRSQRAVQAQREASKVNRKLQSRTRKAEEQQQQFDRRQEKKKQKHRGH